MAIEVVEHRTHHINLLILLAAAIYGMTVLLSFYIWPISELTLIRDNGGAVGLMHVVRVIDGQKNRLSVL